MKTIKKSIVAITLVALMAFSAISAVQGLVSSPNVVGRGSTTVAPVVSLAAPTFPAYWNSLGLGTTGGSVNVNLGGSGQAFPGVYSESTPYSDIGYLSRNPSNAEWTNPSHANAQLWSIGAIDSVAIVKSTGNTWLKTQLTSEQVSDIYTNPAYQYCDDLPAAYLVGTAPHQPLVRVIRETTSGTFECFLNFFLTPFGKTAASVQNPLPFPGNPEVYNYMTTHSNRNNAIAFISLGYVETDPAIAKISIDFPGAPATYYAPTTANVVSGGYKAWRNLWTLTAGIPQAGTADAKTSVLISYLRLPNPSNPGFMGDYSEAPGLSFSEQSGYIPTSRADFTGAPVLKDDLTPYTPLSTQTQGFPDGVVNVYDFLYFTSAYSAYYQSSLLNPYADLNADGAISSSDFFIFNGNY